MPNSFETRFNKRVVRAATRGFGVDVTFSAGGYTTEVFKARRSKEEYTAQGHEYGIEVKVIMRDYILPVECVVIGGEPIEPKRMAQIREVDTGEVFEVQSPDDSTPPAELLPGGYEWLVHTKKIEV